MKMRAFFIYICLQFSFWFCVNYEENVLTSGSQTSTKGCGISYIPTRKKYLTIIAKNLGSYRFVTIILSRKPTTAGGTYC